jgi:hypothetical protein
MDLNQKDACDMAKENKEALGMPAFLNCNPRNKIQGVPGRNMISAE